MKIVFSLLIGLFITLLFFFLANKSINGCCDLYAMAGFPLPFYRTGGFTGLTVVNWPIFVLDVLLWGAIPYILLFLLSFFFKGKREKLLRKFRLFVSFTIAILLLIDVYWFFKFIRFWL